MNGGEWESRDVQEIGKNNSYRRVSIPKEFLDELDYDPDSLDMKMAGNYIICRLGEEQDYEETTLVYEGSLEPESLRSAVLGAMALGAQHLHLEGTPEDADLESDDVDRMLYEMAWTPQYDESPDIIKVPQRNFDMVSYLNSINSGFRQHFRPLSSGEELEEREIRNANITADRIDFEWAALRNTLSPQNPAEAVSEAGEETPYWISLHMSDQLREDLHTANRFVNQIYELQQQGLESAGRIGSAFEGLPKDTQRAIEASHPEIETEVEAPETDVPARKEELQSQIESLIEDSSIEDSETLLELGQLQEIGGQLIETPSKLADRTLQNGGWTLKRRDRKASTPAQ